MPRVIIKYECGCEVSPFVILEEDGEHEIHHFVVAFCENHAMIAKKAAAEIGGRQIN